MPPESAIEKKYQEGIDALTPAERVARCAAMFDWTREQIARQILADEGERDPELLKWKVALRLYANEPFVCRLIQRKLADVSVETFQKTLAKLVAILERHQIRFHLTGGLTGTAYGEPRMTQDIDLVVDPAQISLSLDDFLDSLAESDFMFDESAIREAVNAASMFQLLDEREVLKLDIYPRELIEGELSRSEMMEIFEGAMLPVVSRVDAAASKLAWISKGSHKSRRDLRAIHRGASQQQQAELAVLAEKLELGELLAEVLSEPDEME